MTELSLYWDLADAQPYKRMCAALKLADSLKEFETNPPTSTDSTEKPLIKIKNSAHQYAINRLVRGLTSFNDCARQGFCLALQLALEAVPSIDRAAVCNGIFSLCSTGASGNVDDQKDKAAARIFGLLALQRAGFFTTRACAAQLAPAIEGLWSVFDLRVILREAAASVIFAIVRDATSHSEGVAIRLVAQRVKSLVNAVGAWQAPRKLEVLSAQKQQKKGKNARKEAAQEGSNLAVVGTIDLSLLWLSLQVQDQLLDSSADLQFLRKFTLGGAVAEAIAYSLVHGNMPVAPRLHSVWNLIAERVAQGDKGAAEAFVRACANIHVNRLVDNTEDEDSVSTRTGQLSPERVVILVRALAVVVRSVAASPTTGVEVFTKEVIPNISTLLEVALRCSGQGQTQTKTSVVRALQEVQEGLALVTNAPVAQMLALPTQRTPAAINAQFQRANEQELNLRFALTHPTLEAVTGDLVSELRVALFRAFVSASSKVTSGTTKRAVSQIASLLQNVEGKQLKQLAQSFAEEVTNGKDAASRRAAASWLVQLPFVADGHKADANILQIAAETLRVFARSSDETSSSTEEAEEEYNPDALEEDDDDEDAVSVKEALRAAKAAEKAAKGTSKASYFSMIARAVRTSAIHLDKVSGRSAEQAVEAVKGVKKLVEVLVKEAATRDDDEKVDADLLVASAEASLKAAVKNSSVSGSETGIVYAATALLLASVAATDLPALRPQSAAERKAALDDEVDAESDVELEQEIVEEEDMNSDNEKDEEETSDSDDEEEVEEEEEIGQTATQLLLAEVTAEDEETPLAARLAAAIPSILLGEVVSDTTRSAVESVWEHCLAACVDSEIVLSLAVACGADVLEAGEDDEEGSDDEDNDEESAKDAAKSAAAAVEEDSDDEDEEDSDDEDGEVVDGLSGDEEEEDDIAADDDEEEEELIHISSEDLFSALTEDGTESLIPGMPAALAGSKKNQKRADLLDKDRVDAETRLKAVAVTEPIFAPRTLLKAARLRSEKISGVPAVVLGSNASVPAERRSALLALGELGVAVHAALLLAQNAGAHTKSLRESAARRLMHMVNNAIVSTSDADIESVGKVVDADSVASMAEAAARLAVSFPKQLSGQQRAQLVKATSNLLKFAARLEEVSGHAKVDEESVCGAGALAAVVSAWVSSKKSRVPAELIREVNARHGDLLFRRVDFASLLDQVAQGESALGTSKFLGRELLVALTSLAAKVQDASAFQSKVGDKLKAAAERCMTIADAKRPKEDKKDITEEDEDIDLVGEGKKVAKKTVQVGDFANAKQRKQFREAAQRALQALKQLSQRIAKASASATEKKTDKASVTSLKKTEKKTDKTAAPVGIPKKVVSNKEKTKKIVK